MPREEYGLDDSSRRTETRSKKTVKVSTFRDGFFEWNTPVNADAVVWRFGFNLAHQVKYTQKPLTSEQQIALDAQHFTQAIPATESDSPRELPEIPKISDTELQTKIQAEKNLVSTISPILESGEYYPEPQIHSFFLASIRSASAIFAIFNQRNEEGMIQDSQADLISDLSQLEQETQLLQTMLKQENRQNYDRKKFSARWKLSFEKMFALTEKLKSSNGVGEAPQANVKEYTEALSRFLQAYASYNMSMAMEDDARIAFRLSGDMHHCKMRNDKIDSEVLSAAGRLAHNMTKILELLTSDCSLSQSTESEEKTPFEECVYNLKTKILPLAMRASPTQSSVRLPDLKKIQEMKRCTDGLAKYIKDNSATLKNTYSINLEEFSKYIEEASAFFDKLSDYVQLQTEPKISQTASHSSFYSRSESQTEFPSDNPIDTEEKPMCPSCNIL